MVRPCAGEGEPVHLHVAEAREPGSTEGDSYREKQSKRKGAWKMTQLYCNTTNTSACGSSSKILYMVNHGDRLDIAVIACLAYSLAYSIEQYSVMIGSSKQPDAEQSV